MVLTDVAERGGDGVRVLGVERSGVQSDGGRQQAGHPAAQVSGGGVTPLPTVLQQRVGVGDGPQSIGAFGMRGRASLGLQPERGRGGWCENRLAGAKWVVNAISQHFGSVFLGRDVLPLR